MNTQESCSTGLADVYLESPTTHLKPLHVGLIITLNPRVVFHYSHHKSSAKPYCQLKIEMFPYEIKLP